ncbi:hypothetical protein D3C77_350900 [compost metagenome]
MPVRPVAAGSLRQHRQERRLGVGQLGSALAEIDKTCRLHPLQVTAKGRPVEVDGEQGALVIMPLKLQRARHLAQLAGHAPMVGLDEARHLHCEGRAPRDGAPMAQPLPDPADHGHRIDPGMAPEMAILVAQQRLYIAGGDLLQGHGVAPHAAGVGKGAQRPPLHVEHHPRIGGVERRRRENAIERQQRQKQGYNAQHRAAQPAWQTAQPDEADAATVTKSQPAALPESERANPLEGGRITQRCSPRGYPHPGP